MYQFFVLKLDMDLIDKERRFKCYHFVANMLQYRYRQSLADCVIEDITLRFFGDNCDYFIGNVQFERLNWR